MHNKLFDSRLVTSNGHSKKVGCQNNQPTADETEDRITRREIEFGENVTTESCAHCYASDRNYSLTIKHLMLYFMRITA